MNITKLGIGMADQMNARPHPSPLPRGEGDASDANQIFGCPSLFRRLTFMVARRLTTTRDAQSARTRRTFLPLLGERAGVRASVGLISLLLFSAALVHAQSYSIDWSTIDGGGGTSTGGVYSVTGTIGQPDAGKMSGGNYTLDGGFWGIIAAVQTPGAPLLTITLNSQLSTITLSWPSPSSGFTLQQNTNSVSSVNWSNVLTTPSDDGTTKTLIVNPPAGNRFYRLFKP